MYLEKKKKIEVYDSALCVCECVFLLNQKVFFFFFFPFWNKQEKKRRGPIMNIFNKDTKSQRATTVEQAISGEVSSSQPLKIVQKSKMSFFFLALDES